MIFVFDGKSSASSYVQNIWHTKSVGGGSFISSAAANWEMVITKQAETVWLTVRGPETRATPAPVPEDAEFFGISFKLGTYMPHLPGSVLVNGGINLPDASSKSFWLKGSAWQFPEYDNADMFVDHLIREGLLARDEIVEGILQISRSMPRSVPCGGAFCTRPDYPIKPSSRLSAHGRRRPSCGRASRFLTPYTKPAISIRHT